MLPTQIDLSGCRQSTAIVNGLITTVYVPIDDPTTRALDSIADDSLLDRWILGTHKDLIAPDPDTACWNWHGPLNSKGYGLIYVTRGITADRCFHVGAHVVAWTIEHGTVPRWALIDGRLHRLVLDHGCCGLDASCAGGTTCRHRKCQNVRHLELVTNAENVARGKGRRGERAMLVAARSRRRRRELGLSV
ncbi:HNH endonuclease [Streptomyces hirsutus]|uniref:HNH endonuclease n=1 Tax=Streptomyces hirsutus TaxID=35620 RepID=A0ABZ1GT24_9ACTN|nr:hypothetical protein [Streptomyces hirsutus]WSD09346.1 HNH endonuclease [Streptomyces hirsutus]WTD17204.1 HNH endonuclease [Streptomyces hirsutus]